MQIKTRHFSKHPREYPQVTTEDERKAARNDGTALSVS